MTRPYESAAILSVMNDPSNQLPSKFQCFRSMFGLWGYQISEDTELASAFLAISDLGPDDVRLKMSIIVTALKNYLEYPLVASAILTSIPTLEANETLNLMEKAYSQLWSFAIGLDRSELVSLSVRMIHGIKNELVEKLDPTAKILKTPVQFTHAPSNIFFGYYAPLIIVHSIYYSTFSGIGGFHPAHVHGVEEEASEANDQETPFSDDNRFTRPYSPPGSRCPRIQSPSRRLLQLLRRDQSHKQHRRLLRIHGARDC